MKILGLSARDYRRKATASRVTAHRPRAANPMRKMKSTAAWTSAANPPRARTATTVACAANPPRNPPRETRKKIPKAAKDRADGLSLIRVRIDVATNAAAIGEPIGSAKSSTARAEGRATTGRAGKPAGIAGALEEKLSIGPR